MNWKTSGTLKTQKGMAPNLQLETYNRIVYDRVLEKLTGKAEGKKPLKERLADFNQSMWYITRSKEGELKVYAYIMCWAQLKENRAWEYLKEVYGDALAEDEGDSNYNVVLTIPDSDPNPEEYAKKASKLLTNMLIAPAMVLAKEVNDGSAKEGELVQIDYRPGESYWIKQGVDRLTILFSVKFEDKDDAVFGRVFINEFSKGAPGCPSCDVVTRKNAPPPKELEGAQGLVDDNCYLTFILEKRYLANPAKVLEALVTCRNYINFHIKCSKAFLHIRMRNKVSQLLLVLNRAKPEREVEKKTASGRTFKK